MAYFDSSRLRDPLNVASKFSYLAVLSWVNIALGAWLVASPWMTQRREQGSAWLSGHRGRGPRGFRRSDDGIHEDLCARMAAHPALDASEIDVRVTNGNVVLEGTVQSRSQRRLAGALAESVGGVREIRNDVRVATVGEAPRRFGSVTAADAPSPFPPSRSASS